MDDHLILYDGTCGLCHASVKYLVTHDPQKHFLFAPLQGNTAKKFTLPQVDSIILVENFKSNPKILIKGKAFFEILATLYPALSFLRHLPAFLINPPYDFIAYIRYKLFKRPSCLIPQNLDQSRFLN